MLMEKLKSTRLSGNLRTARLDLGLTQRECAIRAGVALISWVSYERGVRWPCNELQLDKIAKAVDSTAAALLGKRR